MNNSEASIRINSSSTWIKLLPEAAFLCLLFVIYAFGIEDDLHLLEVGVVGWLGFVATKYLNRDFRPYILVISTFAALIYVLGAVDGVMVIILGLLLITVCHLPLSFRLRLSLVILMGAVWAAIRLALFPVFFSTHVVTVLGGFFMFRTMVYLYEIKYKDSRDPAIVRVAYFFLLPNIVFAIFPIIDFKTFLQAFNQERSLRTYERGIYLMTLGLIHLLLYRFIYLYLILPPEQVNSAWQLLGYITFSYALILRLSGIFHLSIGMLCMFGVNLPDIFHNYFLARGFGDYWRRINIYWKDFMTKLFYYPIYFKIRKMGTIKAMVWSTLIVFGINWVLHSYQWFWILGSLSLRVNDALFWGIFGILVAISAAREAQRNKNRTLSDPSIWRTTVNIFLTFFTIAVLWSLWVSPTPGEWSYMMSHMLVISKIDALKITLTTGLAFLVVAALLYLDKNDIWPSQWVLNYDNNRANFRWSYLPLIGLVLISVPALQNWDYRLSDFREGGLNQADQNAQFTGYYDELLTTQNFTSQIWDQTDDREIVNRKLKHTSTLTSTNDLKFKTFIPNTSDSYKGVPFSISSLGIHDREYGEKDPNTVRAVLLGGSLELGGGVLVDQTFENRLEDLLTQDDDLSEVQILNYAMDGQSVIQHLFDLEDRAIKQSPDYVIVALHDKDWVRMMVMLQKLINSGRIEIPYQFLKDIMSKEGIDESSSLHEIYKGLNNHKDSLYTHILKRINEVALNHGAKTVFLYLRSLNADKRAAKGQFRGGGYSDDLDIFRRVAKEEGISQIDLADLFIERNENRFKLGPTDGHLNEAGHQLIAEQAFPILKEILLKEKYDK